MVAVLSKTELSVREKLRIHRFALSSPKSLQELNAPVHWADYWKRLNFSSFKSKRCLAPKTVPGTQNGAWHPKRCLAPKTVPGTQNELRFAARCPELLHGLRRFAPRLPAFRGDGGLKWALPWDKAGFSFALSAEMQKTSEPVSFQHSESQPKELLNAWSGDGNPSLAEPDTPALSAASDESKSGARLTEVLARRWMGRDGRRKRLELNAIRRSQLK